MCWPRRGAALRTPTFMFENFTGVLTTGISPSTGCVTRSIIPRALVCGSSITWFTVFTGVAGTPASSSVLRSGSRLCPAIVFSRIASSSARCFTRSTFLANRGSFASSVSPSAGARRPQNRSFAAAMKIHCPSPQRKLRYGDSEGCPEPSAFGIAPVRR